MGNSRRRGRGTSGQGPRSAAERLPELKFGSPADDVEAEEIRQANAQSQHAVELAYQREIRRFEAAQIDGVIVHEIFVKKGRAQRVDTRATVHEKMLLRKAA